MHLVLFRSILEETWSHFISDIYSIFNLTSIRTSCAVLIAGDCQVMPSPIHELLNLTWVLT